MPAKLRIDKRKPKERLPMEVVNVLHHKGGAHSTKKGKRGYDRKQAKKELRDRFNDRGRALFVCRKRTKEIGWYDFLSGL